MADNTHPALLPIEQIRRDLEGSAIGSRIEYRPVVDTTMSLAFELAASGASEGTVVITEEQTAGRGRFSRPWLAPFGTALLMSVILRPAIGELATLPIAVAVAIARGVESQTGLNVRLKWPNDLLVRGRKLGGILVESRIEGDALVAVVGIGLNVNFSPADVHGIPASSTSLLAETGVPSDRGRLLVSLLRSLDNGFADLRRGISPFDSWRGRLDTIGTWVEVTGGESIVAGIAETVDESGALVVRQADNTLAVLHAGEVTLQR